MSPRRRASILLAATKDNASDTKIGLCPWMSADGQGQEVGADLLVTSPSRRGVDKRAALTTRHSARVAFCMVRPRDT